MTKTTYTATDANGTVHTRKTDRVYTHCVVVQGSKEYEVGLVNQRVARDIEHAREMIADATRTVEQLFAIFRAKRCEILCRDDSYAVERQKAGKAFIAQWGTPEAYAAAQHEKAIAKIEATDWSVWGIVGWCGRPDLAQKLAAKERGNAYRAAVAILPAVAR